MTQCGVSADKDVLKTFFAQLEGTTVKDAVAAGSKKHVTMPAGGGAAPAKAAAGGAAAAEEKPKEEEKEEAEDVDMGGLFGDEEDDY